MLLIRTWWNCPRDCWYRGAGSGGSSSLPGRLGEKLFQAAEGTHDASSFGREEDCGTLTLRQRR